ncbi:MAG: flavodoxin, partial [Ruminococcus sp.]|nr:flavodoxin [Ruminococcus sp.]
MKKLILTILAAFCMLGFSACGSSAPVETSSQTEAVQQETQAQVTEAEQPGEDKAAPGQTEKQQQGHDSCVL